MVAKKKARVLFVCMGNICRSPTGEGVLKKRADDRGLADRVEVDSAGTIAYHAGERADGRMRRAAEKRGYRLDSVARQFERADFDRFDLIVAMDRSNLADILSVDGSGAHEEKVRLLSDFIGGEWPRDVPDPYYGGASGFETVYEMVRRSCQALLDRIRAG